MADDSGVFKALADPTRRQILQDLRVGELAAGQIAGRFPVWVVSSPLSVPIRSSSVAGGRSTREDAA
jgi:DNA-binding transcriptional ArsR family regulator